MATLDQLSDDQRAIIELLLERRSSYAELSEMLDMPASRVRDHARSALVALAPRTAEGVDPQWRGQVADYLLGQQTGPESKATRAHLKSSEQARSWALSALDSLDHLYANGAEPFIPAGGRAPKAEPRPKPAAKRAAEGKPAKARAKEAARPPKREETPAREGASKAPAKPAGAKPATERRRRPEKTSAAVARRRGLAIAGALLVLVAVVVLLILLIGGGEGDPSAEEAVPTETTPTTAELPPLPAALALQPVDEANAQGQAIIAEQQGQTILIVRAVLPPSARDEVYEVWLYNDQEDAVPVGAQVTDKRGAFQGAGALPADFARYRYIDVSLERADGDTTHSGTSVLRGELATAQPTSPGAAPQGAPAPGGAGSGGGGGQGGGSGGGGGQGGG